MTVTIHWFDWMKTVFIFTITTVLAGGYGVAIALLGLSPAVAFIRGYFSKVKDNDTKDEVKSNDDVE